MSLIKVIHIKVKIGIIIHKLGLAASSSQCFKIALNQTINFKVQIPKAKVIKNIEPTKPKNAVISF